MDWVEKFFDIGLKDVISAAKTLTPEVWKKKALARFNDANPFRSTSVNHDLLRATRLAWIEAALAVIRAARSGTYGDETVVKVAQLATEELSKARDLALERDEDPAFSPIDVHVYAIMNGVAENVAPHGSQTAAQAVTRDFATIFAAVIKWPREELPPAFESIAKSGLATKGGAPRAFGELVFAECAEILKSPTKYPEAREAFYIATDKLARDLAEQTFAAVKGLDAKLDDVLAGRDALVTLRAGLEDYIRLLPQIAEDLSATRAGVEQIENQFDDVRRLIEQALDVARASMTARDQLLRALASLQSDHANLVSIVQGFLLAITAKNVPADQIVATLFRLAAEWRAARDAIEALEQSRNLSPRIKTLLDQALEAHARGDVDGARAALEVIDAQERQLEDRLARHAQEIEEERRSRRAERIRTKNAQIKVALSGLNALDAARHIAERIDLEVDEPTQRFEAFMRINEEFYQRGRGSGVNLDLEVSLELARIALACAADHDQRGRANNRIGVGLWALGERENGVSRLEEAIVAYRAAHNGYKRERNPLEWAKVNHNIGLALYELGDRVKGFTHLSAALLAFKEALKERKRERVPLEWAMTQNNLGLVLSKMGERSEGTEQLEEAVAAYREALQEFTRRRVPLDWAMTQNNLGLALFVLGSREESNANLEKAVIAYRQSLEERKRCRVPLEWATTQSNLGFALAHLGWRTGDINQLEEAVAHCRAALGERKRDRVPLAWGTTQHHLGVALYCLGLRADRNEPMHEAIEAFRAAIKERSRQLMPHYWAATQHQLGNALRVLGDRERDARLQQEALAAYRHALEERPRERNVWERAYTLNTMAMSFLSLSRHSGGDAYRDQGLAAVNEALALYRDKQADRDIAAAEKLRAEILAAKPDVPAPLAP